MKRLSKFLKPAALTAALISVAYLALLLWPQPLFAYHVSHAKFEVWSDRPIAAEIGQVLDDAQHRLRSSILFDGTQPFKVFLCNDRWRLRFFCLGNGEIGGMCHYDLTRHIFIRQCDIPNNQVVPPPTWKFAQKPLTFSDRPLSYFIAHESAHAVESRFTGRGQWKYPTWLIEGYADYVAKNGDFDFRQNLRMLKENAPELDPAQGLYRRYHLCVQYLLEVKKYTVERLFQSPPNEAAVLAELRLLNEI